MKILISSWRDIRNPRGGGAEIVTQEVAKRLVRRGQEVTLFTSAFPGGAKEETIDGVKIIRRGREWTVHFWAYRYYKKYFKGRVDLVIDEINTIPFFTPFYVQEKVVMYINQLAREVWWYQLFFPLNLIGYLLEPIYLRLYRKIITITISESSKQDLVNIGFKKEMIEIIPMAIDFQPVESLEEIAKAKDPTILYFGSLRPMKRPEEIIKALPLIKKTITNIRLQIVGKGSKKDLARLKKLVWKYDLGDNVIFQGRVGVEEKKKIMSQAHLIAVTSIKEGWGLIVTEANALGTPAVVYNVSGLRDAVQDGVTGIVCQENIPACLAENIIELLKNKELYKKLQFNAWEWSKTLTWDRTADRFWEIINKFY